MTILYFFYILFSKNPYNKGEMAVAGLMDLLISVSIALFIVIG